VSGLWVLGYGSLMSAKGLAPQAAAVRDAWPARLAARRRFGKPTTRTGVVALDLDCPRATLDARRGHDGDGIGAALLLLDPAQSQPLAKREGYPEPAWRRLLDAAGVRGLPALLLDLARGTGDDPLAYRRALREVAGPSDLDAYHYLPHPVATDGEPALAFVAPDVGCTGDARCDSAKVVAPRLVPALLDRLHAAREQWPGFDPLAQALYVEKCLLATAHGIDVSDLLGDGLLQDDPTARLLAGWRIDPSPLEAEREALRAMVPPLADPQAYARRFGRALLPV
jgi:hypothetical protein